MTGPEKEASILSMIPIVTHCAKRIYSRMHAHAIPLEDLIQYGMLHVVKAAISYRGLQGAGFLTYVFPTIKPAIWRAALDETSARYHGKGVSFTDLGELARHFSGKRTHYDVDTKLTIEAIRKKAHRRATPHIRTAINVTWEHIVEDRDYEEISSKYGIAKNSLPVYSVLGRKALEASAQ